MFNAILVANRGEIACRIIRSARRLGVRTIAVYSEADRDAPHVDMASDAILIGPPPALDSYLNIDRILDAIDETGADAVHPGYGFLSENAEFAEILAEEGVAFIGPNPHAIRIMGDKIESKKLAEEIGVSTVPGTSEPVEDLEKVRIIAAEIGYPVMVKASAGGGGKGMRLVMDETQLEEGLRASTAEAEASFGDDRVFVEKYIQTPRHIEIQVLADQHGNVVHLGERECSIQRRHQKVVEEAPSPFVDEDLRRRMGDQAIMLAEAVDYVSAGTVEFIVDPDRNFYFLEMNTRLQVEHPVTEEVTGLDLVEQMIRIAAGEELGFTQEEVEIQSWAIETRVYAEDPVRGFLPSIGRLSRYREPVTGVFGKIKTVRVDSGVSEGDMVTRFYDPMLAKLITVGRDRDEALGRMQWALDEYLITGINHNLGFLGALMSHPRFATGNLSTNFIADEFGDRFLPADATYDEPLRMAAIAVALRQLEIARNSQLVGLTLEGDEVEKTYPAAPTDWVVILNDEYHDARVECDGSEFVISLADAEYRVESDWQPGGALFVGKVNGQDICLQIERTDIGYGLYHRGFRAGARVLSPEAAAILQEMPEKVSGDTGKELVSPMPGLLVSVEVAIGQSVRVGDPLAVVEAMKMENMLVAEADGVVSAIPLTPGDSVDLGQVILTFE